MNKARETRERHIQTSFIIQCRHWGLNPQTMELFFSCVLMPLHEWATGSLPPTGRLPTRQVRPSRVHVSV